VVELITLKKVTGILQFFEVNFFFPSDGMLATSQLPPRSSNFLNYFYNTLDTLKKTVAHREVFKKLENVFNSVRQIYPYCIERAFTVTN